MQHRLGGTQRWWQAHYVAAVACKETALVLPLALWLFSADRPLRATLVRLAPLLTLTLAMLLIVLSLPTCRHLLALLRRQALPGVDEERCAGDGAR